MTLRATLATVLAASAALAVLGGPAHARGGEAEVIYGDDDRKEPFDPANDPGMVAAARATAALLYKSQVTPDPANAAKCTLPGALFGDAYQLCAEEPFRDQPNPAFCTGFLVGDDLLVTAGHCVESQENCETIAFVFGFGLDKEGRNPLLSSSQEVYACKKLLSRSLNEPSQTDFALVQLDRKVADRAPLAFRKEGRIDADTAVTVIGHPAGLPTKVAGGAHVRANDAAAFFVTNTDTYGGNSGSPVLNSATHEVEGILVRGEEDFIDKGGCRVSNRCLEGECRGEDVTRATEFAPFVAEATEPARPTKAFRYERKDLAAAIPDDDELGTSTTIEATDEGTLQAISVHVTLRHTYVGDLVITLVHPDGTTVVLREHQGNGAHDLDATYGEGGAPVAGLVHLRGKPAKGTWKVLVKDTAKTDTGTLDAVVLTTTVLAP